MAAQTSQINIAFLTKGDGEVAKAFKRLRGETVRLNRDFQTLSRKSIAEVKREFEKLGNGARNSINAMQAQRNALSGLRNMADVSSREFKELTADIARLDAQMRRAGTGATGLKSRLGGIAKGVGAVASGGIFGGPEGAIGAGLGFAFGGPTGAIVGAGLGTVAKQARESLGEIASFSAELSLQRKALKLVIDDTDKYAKSQRFLATTSRQLAIPQSVITRQFTSLTASVIGAGMSVSDAETAFEAIAAGIRGTGGSLEDMKSAMRAVSQVFSKGKVSAEELRQQLGERLPGAFTLFADSMDKTPAELDKALEQGKVTLEDFMGFANLLFNKYGENAKILAQGPEAAGDRLKTSLEELNDDLGSLLRPIGMQFQTLADDIVRQFGRIVKEIRKMVDGIAQERKLLDLLSLTKNERQKINTKAKDEAVKLIEGTILTKEDVDRIAEYMRKNNLNTFGFRERKIQEMYENVGKTFGELNSFQNDMFFRYALARGQNLSDLTTEFRRKELNNMFNIGQDNSFASWRAQGGGRDEGGESGGAGAGDTALNDIQLGAKKYFDTIKDFGEQTKDVVSNAFKGMEDALVQFVQTGKLNFSDLARSIIADLTRMMVRAAMVNFLSPFPFFKKLFKTNADGNAFAKNGIVPYRKGGVVNSPTMFEYGGSNLGIMGEAGPEAILPLSRGKNGKLGVESSGGVGNIVVNVDASGSSVEGSAGQSKQFGRALAAAIQSEMIKQRRPGGLLT